MRKAYEMVRDNQLKRIQRNSRTSAHSPLRAPFNIGDTVLLWEPALSAPSQASSHLAKAPNRKRKWNATWSGPHIVKARHSSPSGYSYSIWHVDNAELLHMHANRLVIFNPWSDDLPSTSRDLDIPPKYIYGGSIPVGSLMIIPFLDHRGQPFGIARKLGLRPDGYIEFQWLGNDSTRDNLSKTFQPGWTSGRSRRQSVYYGHQRRKDDRPFSDETFRFTDDDVVLHSFELTPKGCLPINIRRAISNSPKCFYTMK